MKTLIRKEDVLVAVASAIGYGIGYALPKAWGQSEIVCFAACLVLGEVVDHIAARLIKTEWAQRSTFNKIFTAIATMAVFLFFTYLSEQLLNHSLWEDLEEEVLIYCVGFSIAGFLISLFSHWVRSYMIRQRYKDGSGGHTMSEAELKDIEKLKGENHEITGDYDKTLAVKTENGIFVAKKDSEVLEFLGIPYAKPPVDNLRWKAPQKADPSEKVWEAYYFGASAMQQDKASMSLKTHTQSEDCLTLNVWKSAAKEKNGGGLKPVLLYIHGGNLTFGGSAEPLYNGRSFVKKYPGVIMVSFNYRLGLFGFIDLSGMQGGEAYADSRNLGIMDQIMALQWVHDNIRSFGGDPDNIMLAGSTMGAYCVNILSTLKETRGLFKKALLISCNDSRVMGDSVNARVRTADLKQEFGAESMEDMLRLPAEKIKDFMVKNMERFWYMPVADGKLIRKNTEQAIRDGDTGDIRFIYGIPAEELTTWLTIGAEKNMYTWIGATCNDLIELYRGTEHEGKLEEAVKFYEEEGLPVNEAKKNALEFRIYRYSPLKNCLILANLGKTVRCFYWDVKSPVEKFGGNSVSVLGALFGNSSSAANLGHIIDGTVEEVFQKLIFNELVKNSPKLAYEEVKGVDALEWSAFDAKKPAVLHIKNRKMKMDEQVLAPEIELINEWLSAE